MNINIEALNNNMMYENIAVETYYDTHDITEEEFVKAKECIKFLVELNNSVPLGKRRTNTYEVEYTNKYNF